MLTRKKSGKQKVKFLGNVQQQQKKKKKSVSEVVTKGRRLSTRKNHLVYHVVGTPQLTIFYTMKFWIKRASFRILRLEPLTRGSPMVYKTRTVRFPLVWYPHFRQKKKRKTERTRASTTLVVWTPHPKKRKICWKECFEKKTLILSVCSMPAFSLSSMWFSDLGTPCITLRERKRLVIR